MIFALREMSGAELSAGAVLMAQARSAWGEYEAALAEQSAAAAGSLAEQARRRTGLVARFRLDATEAHTG